jgi:hypothetical protein
MPTRRSRELRSIDIETEVDGEMIRGSYTVDRGLVRVHLLGAGSKATQVGNFTPGEVALMLLGDLAITLIANRKSRPNVPPRI